MKITSRETLALVLSVVMLLSICALAVGCSQNVSVKFNWAIYFETITIERGSTLTTENAPFLSYEWIEGLYYDADFQNRYNGESIKKDTELFVRVPTEQEYDLSKETESQVKQGYLDWNILNKHPEATIDDVNIDHYFGTYNGNVVLLASSPLIRKTTFDASGAYVFDGVVFRMNEDFRPLVVNNGKVLTIFSAYDEGLITKYEMIKIATIYDAKKICLSYYDINEVLNFYYSHIQSEEK